MITDNEILHDTYVIESAASTILTFHLDIWFKSGRNVNISFPAFEEDVDTKLYVEYLYITIILSYLIIFIEN